MIYLSDISVYKKGNSKGYREKFLCDGLQPCGVVRDAVEAGAHEYGAEDIEEHLERVLVQEVDLVQRLHREVDAAASLKTTTTPIN